MQELTVELDLVVNGERHDGRRVAADLSLVSFLAEELGLTGTKLGCGIGECRACTVAVRPDADTPYTTRQACMLGMRHLVGWEVLTVEGLADGGELGPVQEAFLADDVMQCGYCTAGFAVAGEVVAQHARLGLGGDDLDGLVESVAGQNLCRCTGYVRYRRAIRAVAERAAPATAAAAGPAAVPAVPPIALTRREAAEVGYEPVFDDPRLELIRLLRDGAEIEHSLLVQYLYAAFSVKTPRYAALAGWPSHRYGGRPLHLLGVAIEEMTHLDIVNSLLVALGAAPQMGRQQFPYEQDIYPFDFKLEPLSLDSLAKYVYVEASEEAIDPAKQRTPEDQAFVKKLYAVLGRGQKDAPRPNRVGSLYGKVIRVFDLLARREPDRLDYEAWRAKLDFVREEGETEHFQLFRSIFEGTHPALPGIPEVWHPAHPDHPAIPLQFTSGVPSSGQAVPDEPAPALRHLSNLHYWAVCMLLDQSYRRSHRLHNTARRHMTGPLRSLGGALAQVGKGVPFDVFVAGYASGLDDGESLRLARSMIKQIVLVQDRFARHLPPDYSHRCARETLHEISTIPP